MKIHSDILTFQDILSAVPAGCYLADPGENYNGYTNVGIEGSRSRRNGYVVRLSGSSPYHMQRLSGQGRDVGRVGNFHRTTMLRSRSQRPSSVSTKSLQDFIRSDEGRA